MLACDSTVGIDGGDNDMVDLPLPTFLAPPNMMSSAFDDSIDNRAFTGSERKFNPGLSFVSLLSGHLWTKPKGQSRVIFGHQEGGTFSVLSQQGQLIRDTYYDTENSHLNNLDFWVRQRYAQAHVLPLHSPRVQVADSKSKAEWNAKLRVGGHFTNSQFVEFDGKKNVSREVLRISGARTRLEDLQVGGSADAPVGVGGDAAAGRNVSISEDDNRYGRGHRG
ncbi:hypothetical protein DL765_001867 [Monosporascus sp. GIB2]|nr:hypothetical protein DL765_001867 [Monosporascus sp. GIB2]